MAEAPYQFPWDMIRKYLIYIALFLIAAAIIYGIAKFLGFV